MKLFKSNWSKWHDISVGMMSGQPYLLQARRNKNGKVQFRVSYTMTGAYGCAAPTMEQLKEIKA